MRVVWILLSSTGIVLQLLLIAALLRGAVGRYRVLFTYVVVLFLTTVMEAAAFYNADLFRQASRFYWAIDAVRQVLIFLVVLSFIRQALVGASRRDQLGRLLWGGAAVVSIASLLLTKNPVLGVWMTNLSRNLGFLAVILNLVLWAALIQRQSGDRTLLMVTGGMGIQMAGKAVGHSLRQLSPAVWVVGNLIIVLTHVLCLYIWWQAFRRPAPATAQPLGDGRSDLTRPS